MFFNENCQTHYFLISQFEKQFKGNLPKHNNDAWEMKKKKDKNSSHFRFETRISLCFVIVEQIDKQVNLYTR